MGLTTSKLFRFSILCFAATALFLAVCQSEAYGQTYGTANHRVTVKVQAITLLQANLGTINLNISGSNAVAGQDQMIVTDQSSTLLWGTNSSLKKITVKTNLSSPLYTLQVLAVNPTVGTAAPQVNLSATANDLVLNIGRSSGSCGLLYTAIALASQGTGTDAHTITFTIQTQ
jgi:hypothetical protein